MNRLLLALVLALLPCPAYGLDPHRLVTQYDIDTWLTGNGLPQNSVHAILQDSDGYLWFGTEEGLSRFDGVRFTTFNRAGGHLRHNYVVSLAPARDGGFWVGTLNGGLTHVKDGTFTQHGQKLGTANHIVRTIHEDGFGRVWVGTVGGGLTRIRRDGATTYTRENGLSSDIVRSIIPNPDGSLWVGTSEGLNRFYDGAVTPYTVGDGLPHNTVLSAYRDRRGAIWIGTPGGLSRFENGRFTSFGRADGLPHDVIYTLYEDRAGNLWIATEAGLCRYAEGRFETLTHRDGLSGDRIRSIYEDREGSLWVGTFGGGLSRLQDGKVLPITTRAGLAHDAVGPIFQDRSGTIWLGTHGGGLSAYRDGAFVTYTTRNGLPSDLVESICEDSHGALWIGTTGKGLVRFQGGTFTTVPAHVEGRMAVSVVRADRRGDLWVGYFAGGVERRRGGEVTAYTTADGLAHDMVRSIFEDRDGVMWFGTMGGGISRLENGKFTNFSTRNGFPHDVVGPMYQDAEGAYWIGTFGGGLVRYKNGVFRAITARDGLFDDTIYSILEDNQGFFWMSSNNGITRVSHHELDQFADGAIRRVHALALGESDGMRNRECNGNSPAAIRARDGRLWFATLGGAAVVDPDRMAFNRQPPPMQVERVIADQETLPPAGDFRVPPGKGELEFHYAALTYLAPERVKFRYRLEGFDEQWVEAGTRRVAYYTNIPPGRYTFRVSGSNNDGVWNEAGASYGLRLEPHFYQTPWFYGGCGLLVALLGAGWHRWRVRRLELKARSLRALAEERRLSEMALAESNERLERALEDLRRAQERLVQQERLRALVQMASGVTHYFNNALTPIVGFTDLLLGQPQILEDREKTMAYLKTVNTAAKDATHVVSRLRGFYQPRDAAEVFPLVAIDAIVRQSISMTQPRWKDEAMARGIAVTVGSDLASTPVIPGNESDLREMLTNLIFNAIDAMPNGGRVTVRSRLEDDAVVLEVEDNGTGMTEEVRSRCLEPFFTTKGEEGTGLGLPMVYGIVRRHRGSIRIESEPGAGSLFAVRLPLRPAAAAEPIEEGNGPATTDVGPTGLRILVVDDEAAIRDLVRALLGADRHHVETAADGHEALQKLRLAPFDLVITDRSMPRMSGEQLAVAVKRLRPDTPVLLLTGFGEMMADKGEHPEGVDLLVSKPVTQEGLRRALTTLLAPNARRAVA